MAADYEVSAELVINARNAASGLNAISSKLGAMGSALRGTNSIFGGMVAQAVAFGGAYLGVSAMVSGFTNLATEAFRFQQEVGGAQLGLQSIMAQVEGITDRAGNWSPVGFERAESLSAAAYQHMQDMAITSSATSAELLGIFQATYGAARSAGSSMEQVYDLTANASTAAAALGIDFQQASRDMGAMLRGGAGLDVKLFSSLRSMNAINMDAQAFNRLAPEERIRVLSHALQGFESANAAYGRSLPGALSTTQDLFELFRGAFFGPAFQKMADLLNELNTYLIANKATIRSYLVFAGEKFRDFLVAGVDRARAAFSYVSTHWDEIVSKVQYVVSEFRRLAPIVAAWGATFVKMRIAATALGMAFQAGSWLTGAAAGLSEGVAALGGGGAAAAAGGAAAAEATTAASFGAVLSAAAGPLALLAAAATAVWQGFETFGDLLMPVVADVSEAFAGVGADLLEIWDGIWAALQPIFAAIGGTASGGFLNGLKLFASALRLILIPIRTLAAIIGWVGDNVIKPIFEELARAIIQLQTWFGNLADGVSGVTTAVGRFTSSLRSANEPSTRSNAPGARHNLDNQPGRVGMTLAESQRLIDERVRTLSQNDQTTAAPTGRTTVHNDFRGSRINVEQSFREADPDRVAIRMIDDIQRFSEQRVQSGFAPAFTR